MIPSCPARDYNFEMEMLRRRRVVYQWIALLALLLNVLAPSISNAMALQQGRGGVMEICSASGPRLIRIDRSAAGRADGGVIDTLRQQAEHCPFCAVPDGLPGLPPMAGLPLLWSAGRALSLPRHRHPPASPRLGWSAASPRAPPTSR